MKFFLFTLVIFSMMVRGMEPLPAEKSPQEPHYYPLPKDICAKIALMASRQYPLSVVDKRAPIQQKKDYFFEVMFRSVNWATDVMYKSLLEHQMWGSGSGTSWRLRYDNDTSNDCNEFKLDTKGLVKSSGFDGPNTDGNKHNGVILFAYSCENPVETVVHLFKEHGVSSQEYTGVQKKIETHRGHKYVLSCDSFPAASEPLLGHTMTGLALAAQNRIMIATRDLNRNKFLNWYEYEYGQNATDSSKPDQLFTAQLRASVQVLPEFKRLAWIYGKTLLGISSEHELYIVALHPEKRGQPDAIECIKQITCKKFKNCAAGRPYGAHQLMLVGEDNSLFYVNLKQRLPGKNAFVLKKISEWALEKQKQKKLKTDEQPEVVRCDDPNFDINRIWMYGENIGILRKKKSGDDEEILFFGLTQPTFNAATVNAAIKLIKPNDVADYYKKLEQSKAIKTVKQKKRNKKRR